MEGSFQWEGVLRGNENGRDFSGLLGTHLILTQCPVCSTALSFLCHFFFGGGSYSTQPLLPSSLCSLLKSGTPQHSPRAPPVPLPSFTVARGGVTLQRRVCEVTGGMFYVLKQVRCPSLTCSSFQLLVTSIRYMVRVRTVDNPLL